MWDEAINSHEFVYVEKNPILLSNQHVIFANRNDWSITLISLTEFQCKSWFGHMQCVMWQCQMWQCQMAFLVALNCKFCANEILVDNLFFVAFMNMFPSSTWCLHAQRPVWSGKCAPQKNQNHRDEIYGKNLVITAKLQYSKHRFKH